MFIADRDFVMGMSVTDGRIVWELQLSRRFALHVIKGSGVPVTRAASANLNVTINTLREKLEEWLP